MKAGERSSANRRQQKYWACANAAWSLQRPLRGYKEGDLNSLADRRLSQVSKRKASSGEIGALIALYQSRFIAGTSSTSAATTPVTKNLLANRRAATPGSRAPYRERAWCPSWQTWQTPQKARSQTTGGHDDPPRCLHPCLGAWCALILVVTMDDATSEHLSMFLCTQEGTCIELSRHRADHCPRRPVLQFLHRSGAPTTSPRLWQGAKSTRPI